MKSHKKVLFLCTGNACRSQMAEGWTHFLWKDIIHPFSAGIEKHGIDPFAIQVMKEVGINITSQYSKTIDELPIKNFDLVITLCDHAKENCPIFSGNIKTIHQNFDNPPFLAQFVKTEEEKLNIYRRVRDEIKKFILTLDTFLK